ncbi:hypothetical protein [Nakamurella sp. PAMC28650]|uniref:hypothetical protein n=1 Tax=Nakamurella sp. PAMC28650 TaxID=2762325 RepID=UPI00164E58A5|nr:hypothetical protein [Nakamurella sp. PAMC28650]QNK81370.1 hypothetical protein H7F38_00410 [Nakamurella sp. PAMC28650]
MTTSPSRPRFARIRLRAGLVIPAAMALTLLTACSPTTSGQGAAATNVHPSSAAAGSTTAPAPVSAPAPSAPAPVSTAPASASAGPASSAPVSAAAPAAPPSAAPGAPSSATSAESPTTAAAPAAVTPVTVTAVTVTETATATVTQGSTATHAGSSSTDAKNILGPDGYLGLSLGQSQATARQDAVFVSTPAVTVSCKAWETIAAARISSVLISAKLGIAAISPRSASVMQTPEGMTAGWTATQVHAAYPSFSLSDTHQQDGGPQISVPQNSRAVYKVRFDSQDKVVGFSLLLRNQDCFG